MSAVPNLTLNNGVQIPQFGFGTFQIEPEKTKETTLKAIELGYRHIDTAEMYRNEKQVGEAVRASGIDRSEFFVTSKLNNGAHAYDDALAAFDQTMADLDIEYLDLFLVHWPLPQVGDFVETWRAMEEIYRSGRCRAIGVSNFQPHHLQRLFDETEIVPVVNQIEVHPYLTQDDVREFGTKNGVLTESWAPIAKGKVVDDPTITRIAEQHGKTASQVTLRWHIQRGDIVFPKSVNPDRMRENIDIFDFELSDDEVATISQLNRDDRMGPHPDEFNWTP
ncbi:aldo/keto reductase [Actinobacteria bacterium YIM 96077]|uniref:Aldo/keto reductase n=1 Tax=Phytoactinopolyspora halophila TaxID=1981511 RepID=A0A329QE34_9ACTN|nr:aldo/keto reductase [Phytoactinopolyspora halophila]AYY14010.1 aldo/keto reductase [Actinobacteria bacterium YIM 96077]RAW10261.1 aldo/keto reductase [Phytoactinopolyspora halophila]